MTCSAFARTAAGFTDLFPVQAATWQQLAGGHSQVITSIAACLHDANQTIGPVPFNISESLFLRDCAAVINAGSRSVYQRTNRLGEDIGICTSHLIYTHGVNFCNFSYIYHQPFLIICLFRTARHLVSVLNSWLHMVLSMGDGQQATHAAGGIHVDREL